METETPEDAHCPNCGCSWDLSCFWVLRLDLAQIPLGIFWGSVIVGLGKLLELSPEECLIFSVPAIVASLLSTGRKLLCNACEAEFSYLDKGRGRKALRGRYLSRP